MKEKRKINWKVHIITSIIFLIIGVGIFLAFYLTNKTLYGALNGIMSKVRYAEPIEEEAEE